MTSIGRGMEEGEIHCSSRDKVRGLDISIWNEEIESNEHIERFVLVKLVETMRSLRMEV